MKHHAPYIRVVTSKDEEDVKCTIWTLERTAYEKRVRHSDVLRLRGVIKVCFIDRGALVLTHVETGQTRRADIKGLISTSNHSFAGASGFDYGAVTTAHSLSQNGTLNPDNIGKSSWVVELHPPEIFPSLPMLQGWSPAPLVFLSSSTVIWKVLTSQITVEELASLGDSFVSSMSILSVNSMCSCKFLKLTLAFPTLHWLSGN